MEQPSSSYATTHQEFEMANSDAKTLIEEVDVIAAATLERALMADTMEPTPHRAGRDSLNSIEMIDLDDSNCFLDDYDFKNVTGI